MLRKSDLDNAASLSRAYALACAFAVTALGSSLIADAALAGPRAIKVNPDGSNYDAPSQTPKRGGGKSKPVDPADQVVGDPVTEADPLADAPVPPAELQSGYFSTLTDGLTPSPYTWGGRDWRVNAGSSWNTGMDHSVLVSSRKQKVRFELRDTELDRSVNDPADKRRAEFSGSILGDPARLPNQQELWGAFSFIHEPWADAAAMSDTWGGVYGQLHMGSKYGGSPAFAVRRKADGRLWITTRGEFDVEGTDRYLGTASFGQPHELVYAITLDPLKGKLRVWLDGKMIVDLAEASIGSSYADSYWAFGLYFSGGIAHPVAAEYAHMAYPAPSSLEARIANAPAWPSD